MPSSTERRSSSSQRRTGLSSFGRGGAGNTALSDAVDPDADPVGLVDALLFKPDVFATGRGGCGNMVKNADPDEARRVQDVSSTLPRRRDSESLAHVGRGGAANVFVPTTEGIPVAAHHRRDQSADASPDRRRRWPPDAPDDDDDDDAVAVRDRDKALPGLADKGKAWLLSKMRRA